MRYFIGVMVAIGLLILIIALIIRGGSSGVAPKKINLNDYSNASSSVRMILDGPISATQTHYDAQITVDQNSATLNVLQGYEGIVVDSKSYPMNPSAYAVFLHALSYAGYTKGDASKAVSDERGVCATGYRYIFELHDGDKLVQRYWATSCGTDSYKGNSALTRTLFQTQIPDYGQMTNKVGL